MNVKKNYLLAVWRVFALVVWVIVMPQVFVLGRLVSWKGHVNVPHYFHAGVRKILGLNVSFSGNLCTEKPTLYVSNHISYLDIFVLGDIRAYFIAKAEVASWPVLGRYARYQNTLFIERKAGRAKRQLEVMQGHLRSEKSLILFPEGTSTDGAHVEPFKSSLFEAANLGDNDGDDAIRVAIQPITIAYTHQAGRKMNRAMLDHYAWYATMPFGPHAAKLLPLKKVDIKVHFHPVCYLDQYQTRKQCADECQNVVAEQLDKFVGLI